VIFLSEKTQELMAQVLKTIKNNKEDDDAIVACLLQHTLETKTMTLQEIEARFGHSVRQMISSIHLLSHVTMRNRRSSIEDLRLMLLNVSDDMRVILIVLCERCFILEHANIPPADLKRECRDVFVCSLLPDMPVPRLS
jgi:GTP pyrophosphokinase